MRASVITDRTLDGRGMTARGNRVHGNIILAPVPVAFENEGNTSDHDVFGHAEFDLTAWRRKGQHPHGRRVAVRGTYDRFSGEIVLSLSPVARWP